MEWSIVDEYNCCLREMRLLCGQSGKGMMIVVLIHLGRVHWHVHLQRGLPVFLYNKSISVANKGIIIWHAVMGMRLAFRSASICHMTSLQ